MLHGGQARLVPRTCALPLTTRVTLKNWRRFQLVAVKDVIGPVLYKKVSALVTLLVNRNS